MPGSCCASSSARGERRSEARTPAPSAAEIERALHAAAYIEAQAAEPLSLADVAAQVGLSRFHFLRLFRRVVGLTPHQLLLRARIRRAAELLLSPSSEYGDGGRDSITDIAYGVGFGDLSNFVRTFGRLVGCSPRQWRRGGLRAQRNILQERLRLKR